MPREGKVVRMTARAGGTVTDTDLNLYKVVSASWNTLLSTINLSSTSVVI